MTNSLRIVQLYPDLLGVTGDRGNVDVLATRASAHGVTVVVDKLGIGEGDLDGANIVVLGNGPLSALRTVMSDLTARADALRAHIATGGVVLAVGGGAEALGNSITTLEGETIAGVGVLPISVKRQRDRRVGYVVGTAGGQQIVGFEDHASVWTRDGDGEAWATLTAGVGAFGDHRDGVRVGNAIATAVQGPLLPLNPALADELIAAAATHAGVALAQPSGLDEINAYATGARDKILALRDSQYTVINL